MDEEDELKVYWSRPVSRIEKAAFTALPWLLLSIVVGTFIVIFIDASPILRQLNAMLCILYLGGAIYKWYRLKNIHDTNRGVVIDE